MQDTESIPGRNRSTRKDFCLLPTLWDFVFLFLKCMERPCVQSREAGAETEVAVGPWSLTRFISEAPPVSPAARVTSGLSSHSSADLVRGLKGGGGGEDACHQSCSPEHLGLAAT